MEELNNRQVVLLTMFVSFVVSIATGIITVAMLQEAPPTLTQTVNRVVEHTIERVTTGTTTERIIQVPVVTTAKDQPQTQYQSEDDKVSSAVEKNEKRLVEIWAGTGTTSPATDFGVLVSQDGVIAVEASRFYEDAPDKVVYDVRVDGQFYKAGYIAKTSADFITSAPVTFLKITNAPAKFVFDPVTFLTKSPKLGQTVLVLSTGDGSGVLKTNITRFTSSVNASSSPKSLDGIYTAIGFQKESAGALVVNLDGQAVGIVTRVTEISSKDYFIYPVSRILELVNEYSSSAPKT